MKNLFHFLFAIFFFLTNTSCGVLLDNAKIQGQWELNKVIFYKTNSQFNSFYGIEGIDDDRTSDTEVPLQSQFFAVDSSSITMYIESNSTFDVKDSDNNSVVKGTWSIDTYKNTFNIKTDTSTTNKIWGKKSISITNSWVMSTNNKWQLYVKASDFDLDKFVFNVEEKPVPDKIEKERFENTIAPLVSGSPALEEFHQAYKIDSSGQYYVFQNSLSPESKNHIYQYLTQLNFVYQTTTVEFTSMQAHFLRHGYTE